MWMGTCRIFFFNLSVNLLCSALIPVSGINTSSWWSSVLSADHILTVSLSSSCQNCCTYVFTGNQIIGDVSRRDEKQLDIYLKEKFGDNALTSFMKALF